MVNEFLTGVALSGILSDIAQESRLQFALTVTTIVVYGVVVVTLRLDFDTVATNLLTSIRSEIHEVMISTGTS